MSDFLADTGSRAILASLAGVADAVWPYVAIFLAFSVIIFVHELGHFLAAKWAKVRVDRFAVGFGRELVGFTRGETRYSLNVLPFGGYVKMLGQEDFDDKANELKFNSDPRSFPNKSVGKRMVIVSAGVIMNLVLAFVLFMVVFMIGLETVGPRIGLVAPGSPADLVGLQPGDKVEAINGARIREYNDIMMATALAKPHVPLRFDITRNGEKLDPIFVEPEQDIDEGRPIVGLGMSQSAEVGLVNEDSRVPADKQIRVGDRLIEVAGTTVTDENVNQILHMLPTIEGKVIVERPDPNDPKGEPKRIEVVTPPLFALYPSELTDSSSTHVLGLTPLVRFDFVEPGGRADLSGLSAGDSIVAFGDAKYPSQKEIDRIVRFSAERDVYFEVQRADRSHRKGFVRPRAYGKGKATIQATIAGTGGSDVGTPSAPRTEFRDVAKYGAAFEAGLEPGDKIVSWAGTRFPSQRYVVASVGQSRGKSIPVTVEKADGKQISTIVVPEAPGDLEAGYRLVADDIMRVGGVYPEVQGDPTPAAKAGIPVGALIKSLNGTPIENWRQLVDEFRVNAGTTTALTFADPSGVEQTVDFDVPHSLRTKLGVGLGARILSIAGRESITLTVGDKQRSVSVGHPAGTRAALSDLVGKSDVEVQYRPTSLSPIETATIDVTYDMVDPWLARVELGRSFHTMPARTTLKASNPVEAIWLGVHKTHYFVLMAYTFLNRMIVSRSVGVENVSGPLGILDMGGKVARAGFVQLLFFMAMISANLAVINFLPLPIMDGGLMVFLLIEKIKGSPVGLKVQVATQMIGLFLIVGIFLFVTFNDAMRLFG